MAKPKNELPAEIITLYDKLIATNKELERKGDTVPYTSHNGNMFTYLYKDGTMAMRLSAEDREAFMKKFKTGLMQAYGITQKEYVAIPANLLARTKELKPYLDKSFAYVKTLKAKPTSKKK